MSGRHGRRYTGATCRSADEEARPSGNRARTTGFARLSLSRPLGTIALMRIVFVSILVLLGCATLAVAAEPAPSASPAAHNDMPPNMEAFRVVLLVRPPHAPEFDKARLDEIQEGHMANIRRLHDEGKLLKAGPFEDYSGREVLGMFILHTDQLEEAKAWVSTDPAVKAGRFAPEFLRWYVLKGSLK